MEIRQITADEMTIKSKIQSIAFNFRQDFSKPEENPEGFQLEYDTGRAAFDDQGKMCSCLELIPFEVSFDSSIVKMGGIGAVATLPEERQKRYIRNIFEYVMKEMYEKDYTFSYLYPFSHPYYRKFGYELNMIRRCYNMGASSFRQLARTGKMRLLTSEEDPVDVKNIYDEFIRDKNLAIVRTDKLWKQFLGKDPYKDNVYLYVWHDDSGRARSYIRYQIQDSPSGEPNLHIHELIWLDSNAFAGILGFIGDLSTQANKLFWRAPEFVNLLTVFPDPCIVGQEIHTYGMNRIVNAEKALQTMTVPSGRGEATIAVVDDFFPLNTGNYTISWEGGRHTVMKTQSPPDISCDIQALSQLVTGFASIRELNLAGKIAVTGNRATLSQLFPKKLLFINNHF